MSRHPDFASTAQIDAEIRQIIESGEGALMNPSGTRNYEYVVYPEASHRNADRAVEIPIRRGKGWFDLTDAKRVAKKMGPPAGIYSVGKGRFVGYLHRNGRFVTFR